MDYKTMDFHNPLDNELELQVAFLLTKPVSDLVNPDCFNFSFSGDENLDIREIKIEVFQHFPQTANLKKSRDQCFGERLAV